MHRTPILPRGSRILIGLLAALLALTAWPSARGYAQETPPSYAFEECETVEEASLRDELNELTQSIFATSGEQIDVAALVDRTWIALDIDSTIDREVEAAVQSIYQDESYWNRFLSGWSADKAEEFTTQIANNAFSSEGFRSQIEALSGAVATAVAEEMTVVSARSASSALLCVQSFVGDSYSDTMAALFEAEIAQGVSNIDLSNVDANVQPLLQSHTRSLAGVGVIIGAQIARRLAQKVAQRIAGKVVGRVLGKAAASVIPIAGWVIGGGLIVWDLIEGGRGALPQIQTALQEENVKATIRQEVTATVEDELRKEMPEIARTVSNDVYSSWLDFKRKYTQVLDLADESPQFRSLIEEVTAEEVGKLATLVVTVEQSVGREGLLRAIDDGQLKELLYLPQSAYDILRDTSNPGLVLAWAYLAGADLDAVVATELYKVATPESFLDAGDMKKILALGNKDAVRDVMLLNRLERDVLMALPASSVAALATQFTAEDLRWLARYIADMEPRDANLLVDRLLRDASLMPKLQNEPVRQAVVASADVDETLAFLTTEPVDVQQSPVAQMGRVLEDAERLANGEVSWLLFWRKYGTLRNLAILLGAVFVLVVAVRLLFRRPQPVHVTVNVPKDRG